MPDRKIRNGTLGYDVGQTPSKPVIVTDPDKGTIASQDSALQELIMDSPGNRAFPLSYDTKCVEVQYLDIDSPSGKTYTMPETRIAVPQVGVGEDDLSPVGYAVYERVRTLFAEAARSDEVDLRALIGLCEAAGIDGAIVSAAASENFSDDLADALES